MVEVCAHKKKHPV